jgi:hypothetical protein
VARSGPRQAPTTGSRRKDGNECHDAVTESTNAGRAGISTAGLTAAGTWSDSGRGSRARSPRTSPQVKRAAILKGEAGIGRKRRDITFDQVRAEKRPNTIRSYAGYLGALTRSFAGKRLSELHPFLIEKHKRGRLEAGARVMANRESRS